MRRTIFGEVGGRGAPNDKREVSHVIGDSILLARPLISPTANAAAIETARPHTL